MHVYVYVCIGTLHTHIPIPETWVGAWVVGWVDLWDHVTSLKIEINLDKNSILFEDL